MVAERFPPDDPREWLNRARSNLLRARMASAGMYLEDACFDAQQAAEKAIKGVMIHRSIEFPYTHDLGRLLTDLERAGEEIPSAVKQAERLTRFAYAHRYPGTSEPVTAEQYPEYLTIAEAVVRWAEDRVGYRP